MQLEDPFEKIIMFKNNICTFYLIIGNVIFIW